MRKYLDFVGNVGLFILQAARRALVPPFEWRMILRQTEVAGWKSLPLILCSGVALGLVLAIHTQSTLNQLGAGALMPSVQSLAFFNEIGPLVAGLLMAGRVGAGIGAELANMRATEQIDAIEALSVDSFKMLVIPRIIACAAALPLLTVFMDFAGLAGGYLAERFTSGMSPGLYLFRAFHEVSLGNVYSAHREDRGFRNHSRFDLLLPRLHHKRGCRWSWARCHQQCCHFVGRDHSHRRCIRQGDPVPVSGYSHMNSGNPPVIALHEVNRSFDGRDVLKNMSFEVAPGEALCLLGRSGMGKSVTLKLIIGLIRPDSGTICVDGQNIVDMNEDGLSKVRSRMGFLFQGAALFDSMSLYENLALPLKRLRPETPDSEIAAIVQKNLDDVGLGKDGHKMPMELSGGMRKRAGLARSLMLDPHILLIDEPVSGLDRVTASEIDDLLLQVKERDRPDDGDCYSRHSRSAAGRRSGCSAR